MRLLIPFYPGDMGERRRRFFIYIRGKYGFGHYDLNPPQSQLLAGDTANKLIETSS